MMPVDERHSYSRLYLLARIATALGGRVAEQQVFGDITTGAENDLQQATKLAREMVTRWGMSERIGSIFLAREQEAFVGRELGIGQEKEYSERLASQVDEEVQRIVGQQYAAVQQLLQHYRDQLEQLAQALLDREIVQQDELLQIAGGGGAAATLATPAGAGAGEGDAHRPTASPPEIATPVG